MQVHALVYRLYMIRVECMWQEQCDQQCTSAIWPFTEKISLNPWPSLTGRNYFFQSMVFLYINIVICMCSFKVKIQLYLWIHQTHTKRPVHLQINGGCTPQWQDAHQVKVFWPAVLIELRVFCSSFSESNILFWEEVTWDSEVLMGDSEVLMGGS